MQVKWLSRNGKHQRSMLQQGTKVMLLGLQSSADLNFKQGVLGAYLPDCQRWVVELPCGRQVKVRQANMQTMEASVQNFYRMFGYPDQNTPALADLVEERTGQHGRYLVAKQPISKSTYARDNKLRVSMPADESKQLAIRFDAFVGQSVSTILHEQIIMPVQERDWNQTASYLGKCVRQGWLQNGLVRDLMRYDSYSPTILQETMERLHFEDLLWFEFWRTEMPDVPADVLWCLQSFVMSHAFLQDRTIMVGFSSLAQCTDGRWTALNAKRRGEQTSPLPNDASVIGNFMEMPFWLVQPQQARDQIPVQECIIFHEDIRAGEELLVDYEEHYFPDKQLRDTCPPDLRPVLFHIVSRLDPRVAQALEAHMHE